MFLNLIWDFDGTLFDTYPAIANSLWAAVSDLAVPPSFEDVRDMALLSIDGCLKTMSTTYDLPLEELEAGFERHYAAVTADDQPPFDGVREGCELLCARGGLNLIVTHRRRSGMDRLLAAHGLAELITDTVSYDDGYPRKPDPAAFRMLIERHHLRLDHTLAIGDRNIDVRAAHAAGLAHCSPRLPQPSMPISSWRTSVRSVESSRSRRPRALRSTDRGEDPKG